MPVEAPSAGTVAAVHVAEAQAVDEGAPLVTLDP
jgi:biotin carboxyl carrier protein